VKTDETLDGITAGFVAAVANALSRGISAKRMKELIANPGKLRSLLLPILDDDWSTMLSSVTYRMLCYDQTLGQIVWYRLGSGDNEAQTMRGIMREATDRKYAPLSEKGARKLCGLMQKADHAHGRYPYVRNEKLRMLICGLDGSITDSKVNLDEYEEHILGDIFFFRKGFEDRSDCFKC